MNEPKAAKFHFQEFEITRIAFDVQNSKGSKLLIRLNPTGRYFEKENRFEMELEVSTFTDSTDNPPLWKINMLSKFVFSDQTPFENIPPYFFKNAIAIVFPYIRAFLSSISLQANTTITLLPILNLVGLEEEFEKNTTKVED